MVAIGPASSEQNRTGMSLKPELKHTAIGPTGRLRALLSQNQNFTGSGSPAEAMKVHTRGNGERLMPWRPRSISQRGDYNALADRQL